MRGNGSKSNQWTKTDDIIAGTLLRENVKEQNDGNAHHAKETKETPRRDQGAGDCGDATSKHWMRAEMVE